MNPTIELLERVRARTETGSDYAVASLIGISRSRMSRYMNGKDQIEDDAAIIAAAEICGDDPAATLARFRAAKTKSPKARAQWLKLERLAIKSAAACLVVGAVTSAPALLSQEGATTGFAPDQAAPTMYIMLSNIV